MTYRITYFAPYTFANFTCTATSMEDGRRQRDEFNARRCYEISRREIKSETFK